MISQLRFNKGCLCSAALAALSLFPCAEKVRADYVIHSDTFSRLGTLNNSLPDQSGSSWVADSAWQTDGSRANVSTYSRLAYLPFKPRAGNVYTLSMRVCCTSASPSYEWVAVGFAKGMATQGAWHVTNDPVGWMLLRFQSDAAHQAQTFPGGDAGVFSGTHTLMVILDTRPTPSANWTFEFKVDGTTVRGPVAASGAAEITSVGLGNGAGLGWVDDFTLTSLIDDSLTSLAESIRTLTPPFRGATNLILPTLPTGYRLSVKSSSNSAVVGLGGTITPPATHAVVELVLTVIRTSDGLTADTQPIKVYVPAIRTEPPAATYADNFRLRQGLFVTWTGVPDGQANPIVFSDGTQATTMDQFADSADVKAVADQVALYGFDHVVLMDFHGAGTTLHPCTVLDAWRGPGFTSRRDLIGEMIAAFKARNIKVYLFTHPLDGHDYSVAQQTLLGFNDPSGNYQKWNDFINDVHAEIVERYGQDIVGIGMDSEFGMSSDSRWAGKLDLPRLRTTILSRSPGLSLSALAGPNNTCELGIKEMWRPSWLDPWGSRPDTDYNVETWPAYRRVIAAVQGYHWATIIPPAQGTARLSGAQMFRYSVLQAAAATEGPGVQWAASPYTDGTWENGIAAAFADLHALTQPVAEALRDVISSTSYPVAEGAFLSTLPNGIVATKRGDDSAEYIHVLNPPAGKFLALPSPADGKCFSSASLLPSGKAVALQQDATGLRLTLGNDDAWIPFDTVIKLIVVATNRPLRNLALHGYVSSLSSIENGGSLGNQVPWGRVRLVDGLRSVVPSPASWSIAINGWTGSQAMTSKAEWVQVDLGIAHQVDTVRLHPRVDAGNVGYGFPVTFDILTSVNGTDWTQVASVTNLPLPLTSQTYTFALRQARYVRVAASELRANPNDAGRFALQFAELEVFGPASRCTVESSPVLPGTFTGEAFAYMQMDLKRISIPMRGSAGFFTLRGDPPPDILRVWTEDRTFLVEFN